MKKTYSFILSMCALLAWNLAEAQYCTPQYGTGCGIGDQIQHFSTSGGSTNITNNNSGCSSSSWGLFLSMEHTALANGTVNISVQAGSAYAQGFRIYVDWNQDGDFYDTGEDVWNSGTTGSGAFTGSFNVPTTAVPGSTRMRVRSNWASLPSDPCNYQSYGEAEDYTLTILPPYADDAGIAGLLSPVLPTCDLDSVDIIAVLTNMGSDTLTNCSIHYKVGTSAVVSTYYTGSVNPQGGLDTVNLGSVNFTNLDDLFVYTTDPNGATDSLWQNDSTHLVVATGLAGTYSIPNDYATINDAVSDLEEFGVCDSVIFNIAAGTYNEQVIFGDIVGTSEDATVTFQSATGNVNDVTITHAGSSSANGFVIDFAGGDWITFRDVKIQNTGSYYGQVVSISGQSDNITVEDCWLKGIGGTSTTYQSLIHIGGTPNNTTFLGNTLEKGSCWFYSTSGSTATKKENLVMEDNLMKDQSYYGSYIYYWDGVEFHGNTIKNDSAFQYSTGYYAMGRWYYVDNFNVTNNYVGATAGNGWYYGMYMYSCVGSSNPRSVMANNCIITGNNNSSAYYALYMSQSGLVDIYNNSFTRAGTNSSYAGYIYQGGAINLKNNNFINYGSNWALYVNGGFTVNESDHNNY